MGKLCYFYTELQCVYVYFSSPKLIGLVLSDFRCHRNEDCIKIVIWTTGSLILSKTVHTSLSVLCV